MRLVLLAILLTLAPHATAHPQDLAETRTSLPDAPSAARAQGPFAQTGSASVTGSVRNPNGDPVPGAAVTAVDDAGHRQSATTGTDGSFTFPALAAGTWRLEIAAPGFTPATLPAIPLAGAEQHALPPVTLVLASASASVTVTTNERQIALEDLHAELHQRVLGILPNFYTSYLWDAPPLDTREKFTLAAHSAFDPVAVASIAVVAGIEQARNIYPGYGSDAAGYGRRFGASFGDEAIGRFFGSAIYPSIFHQDPRYFYKGTGSKPSRALYAVSRTVVTRGTNGRAEPNYSLILGRFTAGAIANLYHDSSDRGAGLTVENAFLNLAGNAFDNLVREFVLRHFTPSVPDYANGQAAPAPAKP